MSADRELVDLLAELRFRNGGPSLQKIADRLAATRDTDGRPSRGYLSEVLRGLRTPSGDMAAAVAKALGGTTAEQQRARAHAEVVAGAPRVRPAAPPAPAEDDPGRWRSGYVEHVGDLQPAGGLREREDELAELAAFCAGEEPYVWWQAEPWAGKSALMATFAHNPPPDVDVVAFFVTARIAAQSDSTAFVEALLDQLSALVGDRPPAMSTPAARELRRLALLRAAVENAFWAGRRIVLVVDGLDEDRGAETGSGLASVASLLPRHPAPGLRIVVASRPDPPLPDDVPDDHPLRHCHVRRLSVSPYASSIAVRARHELNQLLLGDVAQLDVIGLLTACEDGLTLTELEELTGLDRYRLENLVGGVFGRSIAARPPGASDPDRVLLFTHESLREQAVGRLGTAITRYRERIHTWAKVYAAGRWPETTPRYLLRGYPRMLQSLSDQTRLVELAADHDRHDWLLAFTGGDAAGMAEIKVAQDLIAGQHEPDLYAMIRLALRRDELAARNAGIPAALPALWALLGRPVRGEALAQGMTDGDRRGRALHELAAVVTRDGDHTFAQAIARSIVDGRIREQALARLVEVAVTAGDHHRAGAITRQGIHESRHTQNMVDLFGAVVVTGDLSRAASLARAITDHGRRAQTLTRLLEAGGAGAGSLAGEAEDAARAVADLNGRSSALAGLAFAVRATGHGDSADRLFTEARSLARSISEPGLRSRALARLLRPDPEPPRPDRDGAELPVEALITEAETAARSVTDLVERASTLLALSVAVLTAGDPRRAAAIGRSITDPWHRASALTLLLERAASADGQVDVLAAEVLETVDAVTDPGRRAMALVRLAAALHAVGRTAQVESAVAGAESVAPAIAAAGDRAAIWTALLRAPATGGTERLIEVAHTDVRSIAGRLERTAAQAELTAAIIAAAGPDRAERYARSLTTSDERAAALTQVGHAVAEAGDRPRAQRLAFEAETDARTISPVVRSHTLVALAEAAAAVGEHGLAERVIHAVDDERLRWRSFAQLSRVAAEAGRFQQAVDLVSQVGDPTLRSATNWALARVAATAENLERAEAFVDAIDDPDHHAPALAWLAAVLTSQSRHDRAEAVVHRLDDPHRRVEALIELIRAAATGAGTSGEDGRVRRLTADVDAAIRALPHHDDRIEANIRLIGALALSNPEQARRLTEEVRTAFTTISDREHRAWLLVQLVEVLAANGAADQAQAVARSVDDPQQRAWALVQLIEVLAAAGDTGPAETIAHSLDDPEERSRALALLVRVGGAAGGKRAEAIARTLPDPYRQAEAMADLAASLAEHGDRDRAETTAMAVRDPVHRSWALTQVSAAAVEAGDLDRAERMSRDMSVPDQRVHMLTLVIAAVRATGDHQRAEQLAAEAETVLRSIAQPDRQVQAINALAVVVPSSHACRLLAFALGLESWRRCLPVLAATARPVVLRTTEEYLGTGARGGRR